LAEREEEEEEEIILQNRISESIVLVLILDFILM